MEPTVDPPAIEAAPTPLAMILRLHGGLIDGSRASRLALEAPGAAMAPTIKAAMLSDLRCFFRWCGPAKAPLQTVPAAPDTLVRCRRWLGTAKRNPPNEGCNARAPAR